MKHQTWRGRLDGRRKSSFKGIVLPVLGGLAVWVGGCQSYERQPLDMTRHRAAFMARMPQQPEVRQLADALAGQGDARAEPFDLADGVNMGEAEVVALVFNAELRLARLRAGVTQATAENSGLWEDPSLGVDLTRILQGTPKPWMYTAVVGITLPISGRLAVEKKLAGAEHAAELARVAQREWETRIAVRRAWVNWSAMRLQLTTSHEFFERIDQMLHLIDRMEQAGELTRAEARLFRIERATRAASMARLESQVHEAELGLKQLMGLSPGAQVQFQAVNLGAWKDEELDARGPELLASDSPAMVVALMEYEAAERSLELEVRRQLPDLRIGPGYGREDGQDQALLELSAPIPLFNRNRQAIAQATARRELARAAAETTLEQLIASLQVARLRLEATRRQREAFDAHVVPLVDALYADVTQVVQLGEVSALILLESLMRQQEAKGQLIDALRDEAMAHLDVQELIGPAVTLPTDSSGLSIEPSGAAQDASRSSN